MLISRFDTDLRKKKFGFAWWRMLTWIMLLVAGFLGSQYVRHAQQVWAALQGLPAGEAENAAKLHDMLTWDLGYLAAVFVVVIATAGCILRQGWARSVLRVVALVLCVWLAYRGVLLWHQWSALEQVRDSVVQQQLEGFKRPLLIALGLQAVSVPALLWLAWQLGQPAVRLQFRSRPG
ncbi:hypothetical protein [Dyella nitratireducens]|uniref:DUF2269 family protein n=1 Tax=Dyella nitratireducens TaxID=1849580 RepID=A0ABQ1GUR4_9GAMM|nr:hypothetical protein [Dyella nitratireducens]GGA50492.1 hypothetical protein GCM10010981_44810 [Dyella nitratireducens]GLQ42596.1 hypothetical protein GCM10007902_24460 [Dyella nitratireducens]